jgi:threonine dehydrogenase-like Zn-dependent dehydrogenase
MSAGATTIRQLTYLGARSLEWREVPAPALESDRAALVRPLTVATCDLDWLIVSGGSPFKAPVPLGHEGIAEVVEIGDSVATIKPGQRVVVPFQISCGECAPCRRGRTGNCASVPFMTTYGFGRGARQWGGFLSDLVCVPYADHMLVPVPAGLEAAAVASASDNIGDAWRAVGPQLAAEAGAPVLIVGGAGPASVGLYAVALASALGASEVTYVDPDATRRQTAGRLGAETLSDIPDRLGPYPVTVDSSGDPRGLALALRSTAPDGVCTSTAIYFDGDPPLPLLDMYVNGITFVTGRGHVRGTIPHVLDLVAGGRLHPDTITTRVITWEDAPAALLEPDWTKLVFER